MRKRNNAKIIMTAALSAIALIGIPTTSHADVSPAQWLSSQVKPSFRAGYTLPRLTRYGWSLPVDTRIELTENWGYALEYGGYVGMETVGRLDDPTSAEAIVAAKTKSDPQRYPLAVICSRQLPGTEAPQDAWVRDANGKVINAQGVSMDGTVWSEEAGAIFSPEAPDTVWKMAGEYRAGPLRALQNRGVPISVVLNGGEYGLNVLGFAQPIWSQDPKIRAAVAAQGGSWRNYASVRKANSEHIIADAVRAAVPQRNLYVYYCAGGGTLRNKDWAIDDWGFYWKDMRGVSDIPSSEIYYRHFNDGFTGRLNLLSLVLNAVAAEIPAGSPLSYNWICAGWPRGDTAQYLADLNRWAGFLKCYYTAGMIGANVGYYDLPPGGFEATFPANAPPVWLRQMVASSHVHALFSQVEGFVRQSDLLPGPMQHAISTSDPAYEFPTGDDHARVLVRKHRTNAQWLITAWIDDGADRTVTVTIPTLGRVSLRARICGSVYTANLADGMVSLLQIDEEGSTFTHASTSVAVVTPIDTTKIGPTAVDRLLWLCADSAVTKDASGLVSAWGSRGTPALSFEQPTSAKRPLLVSGALGGRPALRFTNSQSWLEIPNLGTAGNAFTGAITLFSIFTGATLNGDNRIISATIPNGADWQGGRGFKLTDGVVDLTELKNGIALKVVNGTLDTLLGSIYIGVMGPGYGGFSGDLAEVLVYKGSLTETKAAPIRTYLKDKYRLEVPLITGIGGIGVGSRSSLPAYTIREYGGVVSIMVNRHTPVQSIGIIDASGRIIARQEGANQIRINKNRIGAGARFVLVEDRAGRRVVVPMNVVF